jgi:hypothetical protein
MEITSSKLQKIEIILKKNEVKVMGFENKR